MFRKTTLKELVATKKEGSAYRVVDDVVYGRLGSASWYTNLDYRQRHEELILFKRYSPEEYPKYDNYDAIEVGKDERNPEWIMTERWVCRLPS